MELSGRILDKDTGRPVSYASITITTPNGSYTGIGTQANLSGQFYINNPLAEYPNYITVTHAEYLTSRAQLYEDFFIDYSSDFLLTRKIKDLDPVVVTSGGGQSWVWLLLLAVILASQKKKAVGELNRKDMFTVAIGAGILLSWSLVQKLLCKIGIMDCTPQEGGADSPWNPQFYINNTNELEKLGYAAVAISYVAKAEKIHDAFTLFNDDFSAIMGVFQTLSSKVSVSFLSKVFSSEYGVALLSFLKDGGGILPWDGLSSTHLNQIDNYINNLPVK